MTIDNADVLSVLLFFVGILRGNGWGRCNMYISCPTLDKSLFPAAVFIGSMHICVVVVPLLAGIHFPDRLVPIHSPACAHMLFQTLCWYRLDSEMWNTTHTVITTIATYLSHKILPYHLSWRHTEQSVCATQSSLCAPHRAVCVRHTDQSVCATQSSLCAPHRAVCVRHTEQSVCATQSSLCAPHRAVCVRHTEQSVCGVLWETHNTRLTFPLLLGA